MAIERYEARITANVHPICPPCNQIFIGYKCCIHSGVDVSCIPESQDC